MESLNLSHRRVLFLPLNTTSMIQPCDAGIIAAVKCCYRRLQMGRALDFMDMGENIIYTVDILQGIRWISQAWGKWQVM